MKTTSPPGGSLVGGQPCRAPPPESVRQKEVQLDPPPAASEAV